jgi:hypothetical protein
MKYKSLNFEQILKTFFWTTFGILMVFPLFNRPAISIPEK